MVRDTVVAGSRQLWPGHSTDTLTERAASTLAELLGADDSAAKAIGLTVDIAVPVSVGLAIGAIRAAAIRGGRVQLVLHEATPGSKVGGHTLRLHVGKTEVRADGFSHFVT